MSEPQRPQSDTWYKNQLQEYAQKASMGLPTYKTICEGPPHTPQFRSVICIDGSCFTSPKTFPNRKTAEQAAAKFALIGIREKVKNEGSSRVLTDTIFCKSIINEYAVKMHLGVPTYTTKESKAMLPLFVSTLCLNSVEYVGDAAKNKKEAEQLAAQSAIISILDSESSTTMSEIVRSKFKFYDALKNGKDQSNTQGVNVPTGVNMLQDGGAVSSINKRKEALDSAGTVTAQFAATPNSCPLVPYTTIQPQLPQSASGQNPTIQAMCEPVHDFERQKAETLLAEINLPIVVVPPASELVPQPRSLRPFTSVQAMCEPIREFKRQKPDTSSAEINPPIVFVSPTSEQALACSASAKRRKKKKEKKRAQLQSSLAMVVVPQSSIPDCPTAQ